MPPGHDEHLVAQALELVGVRRGDDDGDAAVGGLAEDAVDLGAGADVHALRRLVGEQQDRARRAAPGR